MKLTTKKVGAFLKSKYDVFEGLHGNRPEKHVTVSVTGVFPSLGDAQMQLFKDESVK